MIALALACLLPFIHVLAFSFSSPAAASSGLVTFWPVDWNTDAYRLIMHDNKFIASFWISVRRAVIGTLISCLLTVITAYPLSKESLRFRSRTVYVWFFVVTMLFGGGLVPNYMVIRAYGLLDTFWVLIIPSAVQVFNITMMLHFFRGLPKELEESAYVDGAGHWKILFIIYLPLSLPSLATVGLFTIVGHWNSWFDGLLYMNKPESYPLQTYLQTIVTNPDMSKMSSLEEVLNVSRETIKTAQIFLGMLPILIVYPFLQRYFVKGITLGSVKG
ncbi:carbohydrate ABC transporter permease [Cohnella soli]|uniref:Carbohydrate ABC transporter permease n=1 Tax=Cohnella soli TaxID=425005 RepID=A0ABW0I0Z9_9BACL